MNTVSAVAKLIPRPPARVDSKKQNVCAPTAKQITTWLKAEQHTTNKDGYMK